MQALSLIVKLSLIQLIWEKSQLLELRSGTSGQESIEFIVTGKKLKQFS